MRVKICGITNPEDARAALTAGADLIGLVFVPASRRYVTLARAKTILADPTIGPSAVGLFQDDALENVVETVNELGLETVQLHGHEPLDYLESLAKRLPKCRWIKAIMIRGPEDIEAIEAYAKPSCFRSRMTAVLLDGPGGGMGTSFDWREVADYLRPRRLHLPPIFLAGGLTPENVVEAIGILNPDGVDVSSGVEASPGCKEVEKMKIFINLSKGWNRRQAEL